MLQPALQRRGWHGEPVTPDTRTVPGLVVYRFAGSLYYANSEYFATQVSSFATSDDPPEWICIDAEAIPDVDYSGGEVLRQLYESLARRGIRLSVAEPMGHVRRTLDRYGLTDELGPDSIFDTVGDAIRAFQRRPRYRS